MRGRGVGMLGMVAQEKVCCVVGIDCRAVVGKLGVGELIDFAVARAAYESVPQKYLRGAVGALGERAGVCRDFPRTPFARPAHRIQFAGHCENSTAPSDSI